MGLIAFFNLEVPKLSLSASAKMLNVEEQQMKTIGLVTTALPFLCMSTCMYVNSCKCSPLHKRQRSCHQTNNGFHLLFFHIQG